MRTALAAILVLASGFVATMPVFDEVRVAHACSCPDCDVVRDAEVIVAGRLGGWRESDRQSVFAQGYVPIEVDLQVDRVFKGSAPGEIVVVDFASLQRGTHQPTWAGAGGACGAFDEDPAGRYIVIGFGGTPLDPWQSNRMRVLFLGDGPSGELYDRAIADLSQRLGQPYPPSVGDSPPAQPATASNDWMFLSAIGAGTLLITLLLLLAGPKREPRDEARRGPPGAPRLD